MKKILVVFGTRPEAIKMAPLVKQLNTQRDLNTVVCVSAQHRQMLDQVLDFFNITPHYDLNIMKENQSLSDITAKTLKKIEEVIEKEQPDLVLVHGDTTTSFAASLAAFYCGVKVGHVEAGLRTYKKYFPFPEEINRQIVGILADFHFAPTNQTKNNLVLEGKDEKTIFVTGNTVIDALNTTVYSNYSNKYLEWAKDSKLILLTAHRRENLGDPMYEIFRAVKRIVEEFSDVKVIYPVHLNPKVQAIANDVLNGVDRVKLIEPLQVIDFHNFINNAYLVLTDSGGIQEEAPSLNVPVLVLRDVTERQEGLSANTLKLVGTCEETIYSETRKMLLDKNLYMDMSNAINPYGDGNASKRIVNIICEKIKSKSI